MRVGFGRDAESGPIQRTDNSQHAIGVSQVDVVSAVPNGIASHICVAGDLESAPIQEVHTGATASRSVSGNAAAGHGENTAVRGLCIMICVLCNTYAAAIPIIIAFRSVAGDTAAAHGDIFPAHQNAAAIVGYVAAYGGALVDCNFAGFIIHAAARRGFVAAYFAAVEVECTACHVHSSAVGLRFISIYFAAVEVERAAGYIHAGAIIYVIVAAYSSAVKIKRAAGQINAAAIHVCGGSCIYQAFAIACYGSAILQIHVAAHEQAAAAVFRCIVAYIDLVEGQSAVS